ncbi:Endo-1%2C4-beta-xylanase A precursor [uncultured Flavonifractor sp.]|nr:Endo-1%2C4-beta-xylanase A precursor [uncultured Flavonifractor sp.]
MKPRKLLALALTFALTATIAVPALAEDILSGSSAAPKFNDTQGHWAEEIIDRWGGYGVVQGDQNGNFNPDQPITRGSMATVMVNLLGLSEKPAENPYQDLSGSEWYADAVLKCTAAGVMQGDGSNCSAGANITRQEATVMFARALGVEEDASPNLSKFADGSDVAGWAAGAVSAMADRGIITGAGDGKVLPTQNIDRASTMAILDKAISTYIVKGGSYEAKDSGITLVRAGDVTISGSAQDILIAPGAAGGSVTLRNASVSGVITINADDVTLSGTASVDEVAVNGDNCSVTLPGKTTVKVADGVTGTKVCGKDVAGGSSTVIGGSTGGDGGYVPPTEPVKQYGTWEAALESSSVPDDVKQYIRYAYLGEYQGVNFKVVPNVIPVGDGFNTSIFDADRNLWIGTDTGILILSEDGKDTTVITSDSKDADYLKYDNVTMLFSDGGSGAWVLCGNPETEENAVCHIIEVK